MFREPERYKLVWGLPLGDRSRDPVDKSSKKFERVLLVFHILEYARIVLRPRWARAARGCTGAARHNRLS